MDRSWMVGLVLPSLLLVPAAGVSAQEVMAPVAVSGSVNGGDCPVPDTIEVDIGLTTYRDGYCNPVWSLDDPRFDGTVTWAMNNDDYGLFTFSTLGVSVVDDEGAWRMVPEVFLETPGVPWPSGPLPTQFVMVGEGAYDGYHAVLTFADWNGDSGTLDGFVVQGELPPVPASTGTP